MNKLLLWLRLLMTYIFYHLKVGDFRRLLINISYTLTAIVFCKIVATIKLIRANLLAMGSQSTSGSLCTQPLLCCPCYSWICSISVHLKTKIVQSCPASSSLNISP